MAQTRRVATVSACASGPIFTDQVTPRASFTLNLGDAPVLLSETKVNGAWGAMSSEPGPWSKLSVAMSPASRHATGFPVGKGCFCFFWASATEEEQAARTNVRMSALRKPVDANMVGNLLQNLSKLVESSEKNL